MEFPSGRFLLGGRGFSQSRGPACRRGGGQYRDRPVRQLRACSCGQESTRGSRAEDRDSGRPVPVQCLWLARTGTGTRRGNCGGSQTPEGLLDRSRDRRDRPRYRHRGLAEQPLGRWPRGRSGLSWRQVSRDGRGSGAGPDPVAGRHADRLCRGAAGLRRRCLLQMAHGALRYRHDVCGAQTSWRKSDRT